MNTLAFTCFHEALHFKERFQANLEILENLENDIHIFQKGNI